MQLEKHIIALLYEHDCVIIPGFGGFVCNYSGARIDTSRQLFLPPFKHISFNRNLKNNDGLLANRISQEESVTYHQANDRIISFTESLKKELNASQRVELKDIGTFLLGEEGTLLFEQNDTVNYLQDAFGLSAFYSPSIQREPLERKIERKLKDKVILPSKDQKGVTVKKRVPYVRYIAVAASLLLLFTLVFIGWQSGVLKNANLASLNPFSDDPAALYHPDPAKLPDTEVTKENVRDLIASNNRNDTSRYLNIIINGSIPLVLSLEESPAPPPVKSKTAKPSSKGRFHIIGGAFSIPENADKFLAKLKQLGYDAVIIDKKLRMVSYGGFSTREEALQAMEKIKALQGDVWLMKM